MRIRINGEEREFVEVPMRLNDLLDRLSLAPQRVAVELNEQIVSRNDWEKTELNDGDRVEIVHFVGGGTAVGSSQ